MDKVKKLKNWQILKAIQGKKIVHLARCLFHIPLNYVGG